LRYRSNLVEGDFCELLRLDEVLKGPPKICNKYCI
jgi:hypothetical protein